MSRFILIVVATFLSVVLFSQQNTTAGELIANLKNGAAVVRLYMNKPKVDMLTKSIKDDKTNESYRKAAQKMLDKHQSDRAIYVQQVIKAFTEKYTFSKVYFMYDYDQKKLKEGVKSGIFLNGKGLKDSTIVLKESHFLIFGRGHNDESIIISQLNGEEMPKEFPVTYKRSIVDLFSFIFPNDKLGNFVAKLNQKLKKFYTKKLMAE
jgi:hypothetical protein